MRARLAVALALVIGGSASAWGAETNGAAGATPPCGPVAEFKTAFKSVHKDAVFTELSLGQTHFAQGVYALDPTTAGIPPGTGALLAEYEGYVQGHKIRVGDIVWLKDGGKTVCAPMIGPYGPGVLGPLHSVKTGKNEEPVAPLSDGKGDEGDLHL